MVLSAELAAAVPSGDAVVLKGVTKNFGSKTAVDKLDLSIPRGGLYGFIGPNGAGKTTAIRMIMSILFPDAGQLSVLGHASALDAKDRIGYLPEERGVYRKMKVGAYLSYIARLKDIPLKMAEPRVRRLLDELDLSGVLQRRCEELSKGMLQKVQFVAAIVHEPDLLILDEPFSGLDPVSMRALREQILAQHARGATVLFSTHVMHQAEEICDHVVMIDRGHKVLDDPLPAIRRRYDPRVIVFEPLEPHTDAGSFPTLPGVEQCSKVDGAFEMRLGEHGDPGDDPAVVLLGADFTGSELDTEYRRQHDSAGQLVRDAAALDVEHAPAGLASRALRGYFLPRRRRVHLGRGEGLPDRAADVRQAAEFRHARQMDPRCLSARRRS
jgi:ABC-2 type transport system ATP-binding protein